MSIIPYHHHHHHHLVLYFEDRRLNKYNFQLTLQRCTCFPTQDKHTTHMTHQYIRHTTSLNHSLAQSSHPWIVRTCARYYQCLATFAALHVESTSYTVTNEILSLPIPYLATGLYVGCSSLTTTNAMVLNRPQRAMPFKNFTILPWPYPLGGPRVQIRHMYQVLDYCSLIVH